MNRRYGYLDSTSDNIYVQQKQGQVCVSAAIGVICMENTYIPVLPGNVMNGFTYDFPIQCQFIKGIGSGAVLAGDQGIFEGLLEACAELKKYGVRAITGNCGFFGYHQKKLAAAVDVPVALSSLVQLPWIAALLKPDEKIGVLSASAGSLTDELLRCCSVPDDVAKRIVVRGLENEKNFSAILTDRGGFNNAEVKDEVVGKAMEIVTEYPEVGAFLLECTEMPPYAYLVQGATQRPVFDYITLLRWMYNGVCQRPYSGWM